MRLAGRALLFAAVTALLPAAARAGGYDTPMLYSARHMGMGGTAIGFVSDPSAMFHNPAGLAHTRTWGLIGDISLLMAKVHATPSTLPSAKDIDSKQTVAPLFLLGGGYRLNETVTLGLGVYPIALAGATYEYLNDAGTATVQNRTRLVFLEASPGFALNLPGRVRLGAGYRVTYVSIERYQGEPASPIAVGANPALDFFMKGINWKGFRVGAQWTALDWLQLGAVYRHRTTTKVTNTSGTALTLPFVNVETTFLLPSKLGLGSRADLGPLGIALDGEYLFNGQNDAYVFKGDRIPSAADPMPTQLPPVPNVFDWKNEITIRAGLEYRLLAAPDGRRPLALRAGYVYDGKTTNRMYPSAFGTPPGPTHVLTAGLGWNGGNWQVNGAFARRFGSGAVTQSDKDMAPRRCLFCSEAGDTPYRIGINGFYVDFSYAY